MKRGEGALHNMIKTKEFLFYFFLSNVSLCSYTAWWFLQELPAEAKGSLGTLWKVLSRYKVNKQSKKAAPAGISKRHQKFHYRGLWSLILRHERPWGRTNASEQRPKSTETSTSSELWGSKTPANLQKTVNVCLMCVPSQALGLIPRLSARWRTFSAEKHHYRGQKAHVVR